MIFPMPGRRNQSYACSWCPAIRLQQVTGRGAESRDGRPTKPWADSSKRARGTKDATDRLIPNRMNISAAYESIEAARSCTKCPPRIVEVVRIRCRGRDIRSIPCGYGKEYISRECKVV